MGRTRAAKVHAKYLGIRNQGGKHFGHRLMAKKMANLASKPRHKIELIFIVESKSIFLLNMSTVDHFQVVFMNQHFSAEYFLCSSVTVN